MGSGRTPAHASGSQKVDIGVESPVGLSPVPTRIPESESGTRAGGGRRHVGSPGGCSVGSRAASKDGHAGKGSSKCGLSVGSVGGVSEWRLGSSGMVVDHVGLLDRVSPCVGLLGGLHQIGSFESADIASLFVGNLSNVGSHRNPDGAWNPAVGCHCLRRGGGI